MQTNYLSNALILMDHAKQSLIKVSRNRYVKTSISIYDFRVVTELMIVFSFSAKSRD